MEFSHFLVCLCRQETAVLIATLELVCVVLGSTENAGAGLRSALCKCFCVELHKSFAFFSFFLKEKKEIFHANHYIFQLNSLLN